MEKKLFLGIEFGSTRIKAVLIDEGFAPVAIGAHTWENRFEQAYWTYRYADIWAGLQDCYAVLARDYSAKFGKPLTKIDGMGISAMMHGYLPLDANGKELAAFRTWRNTTTGEAAALLSERFGFTIPLRWSIAHLHQAILNKESHVEDISFITSLAGYVHYKLTGENVLGVGDASGVFPVADGGKAYHPRMLDAYVAICKEAGRPMTQDALEALFPRILPAGAAAGALTAEGAALLDPTGVLQAGVPFCPPEGDAGTGMVATNSIAAHTGNVSAGTSIFAMIVLEKSLSRLYPEIDMVTTPDGKPVAMVHCNNCATEIDAWVRLLADAAQTITTTAPDMNTVYANLFNAALQGESDGGGITAVGYHSGEHNTGFDEGRPLLVRTAEARFTPANLLRTLLYSAFATLKLGMANITEKESVPIDKIYGHGGIFTVKGVAQQLLASALNVPVTVMETASEGGAWGIALLAAYLQHSHHTLDAFLADQVFAAQAGTSLPPIPADVEGFAAFMKRFVAALEVERAAVRVL